MVSKRFVLSQWSNQYLNNLAQICSKCKDTSSIPDPDIINCCLTRILSEEEDFKSERSALETLHEKYGAQCLFLPKFHCELNPIEMVWGHAKRYCRKHCDYSFPHLKDRVPEALDAIPIATIRRFIRLSDRFVNIYQKGLTGRFANFAARKYTSHRRVPDTVIEDLKEQWEEHQQRNK